MSAKDLLREEDRALLSIMVILKHGLNLATQREMYLHKLTLVVLELGKMDRRDLIQELELSAKDSPKREDRALLNTTETAKLGSTTAIQEETHMLRLMVEQELMPLSVESELSAKVSLRREERASLKCSITEILKLGSMTATQAETHTLKLMAVLVSTLPLLVLESNAKV